jgi:hypothetical protein
MKKTLQPNQSQKRPDQWIKRCPEYLEKHRLYDGSSSAGQVHHPPHDHHHADQHPLKKTGEKKQFIVCIISIQKVNQQK